MTPLFKRVARRGALLLAAGLLAGGAGAASAAYPERAITLVVTYPPGGTVDVVARLIGPKLAAELGQPVVIENRGGAGGMIGGAVVAKAQPDGYTLMLDASNHAQNPALHSRMQFDTLTAFAPVSLPLRVPNVLVVTPSYEVKTVADLIKLGQPDQRAMSTSPRPVPARPSTWPASCSTCWPRPSCSTWPTRAAARP